MSEITVYNPFEAAISETFARADAAYARADAALQVANQTNSNLIAYQAVTDDRLDDQAARLELLEDFMARGNNNRPRERNNSRPVHVSAPPPCDGAPAPQRVSGAKTQGSAMALYFKHLSGSLTHIASVSKAKVMFKSKEGFVVFYNVSGVETAWKM